MKMKDRTVHDTHNNYLVIPREYRQSLHLLLTRKVRPGL
jgi:hypothetical protein